MVVRVHGVHVAAVRFRAARRKWTFEVRVHGLPLRGEATGGLPLRGEATGGVHVAAACPYGRSPGVRFRAARQDNSQVCRLN